MKRQSGRAFDTVVESLVCLILKRVKGTLILWDTEIFNDLGVLQEMTFELATFTQKMASYPNPSVVANDVNVLNLAALHFSSEEIKSFLMQGFASKT